MTDAISSLGRGASVDRIAPVEERKLGFLPSCLKAARGYYFDLSEEKRDLACALARG